MSFCYMGHGSADAASHTLPNVSQTPRTSFLEACLCAFPSVCVRSKLRGRLLTCALYDECYLLSPYVMKHVMLELFAVPQSPCFLYIMLEHGSRLMYVIDLENGTAQLIMRMII